VQWFSGPDISKTITEKDLQLIDEDDSTNESMSIPTFS